jgi:hypothetical protein
MNHPDKGVKVSISPAGTIQTVPEPTTAFVIEDEEDNPIGILEKWNGAAWIYASKETLVDIN